MTIVKIASLVERNPGLDAIGLVKVGYKPSRWGSLKRAEDAGLIIYISNGWYVTEEGKS